MICLSWNCRGLGQARAVQALIELVKNHRPMVIFLFKTLVNSNKIESFRVKMGFQNSSGQIRPWRWSCCSMERSGKMQSYELLDPPY